MPVKYDKSKVIAPGTSFKLTKEMVDEMLKCARSVEYFAFNHCKVVHPSKGRVPLELRPYQERMLRTIDQHKRSVVLSPRQVGKCGLGSTYITIKHRDSGEERQITLEDFYEMLKNKPYLPD